MRKLLPIIALCLLTAAPCLADSALLTLPALTAACVQTQRQEGQAALSLLLSNRTEEPLAVCLFAPKLDGQDAGFAGGTANVILSLAPLEERAVSLTIEADRPAGLPDQASFRFSLEGRITTEAVLSLTGPAVQPAGPVPREEEILSPLVTLAGEAGNGPVTLTDPVPPDHMPESACARICLKETDGTLRLLATLPARTDPDGRTTACFSGWALALDGETPFLLSAKEETDETGTVWTAGPVGLFSDTIYFATLSARVLREHDAPDAQAEAALEADEFGRVSRAPYALFEEGTVSALTYDGPGDGATRSLFIGGPLRLTLLPARTLGEILCVFEYDLPDGTVVIRPPVPVS